MGCVQASVGLDDVWVVIRWDGDNPEWRGGLGSESVLCRWWGRPDVPQSY